MEQLVLPTCGQRSKCLLPLDVLPTLDVSVLSVSSRHVTRSSDAASEACSLSSARQSKKHVSDRLHDTWEAEKFEFCVRIVPLSTVDHSIQDPRSHSISIGTSKQSD